MKDQQAIKQRSPMKERFRMKISAYASEISIFCALVVICTIVACISPYFLLPKNILNILSYISIAGVMSAGLTVVMLMGCMDLSQYSSMAMIGMFMAIMLEKGINPWLCMLAALLIGAVVGCVNAFTVTKMRIMPMIATIGMQLIARSVAYLSTNGTYIMVTDDVLYNIGFTTFLGVPYPVWILLVVCVVLTYILTNTSFGRKVYAVGGNAEACKLSGINVNRMKFIGYLISGTASAVAAIICTSQVSAAYPTAGSGQEMDCVAAVFLGGMSATGGKGSIVGTIIGVLIIGVLLNAMTLLRINAYYQTLFKGLVLLLAVYIDQARQFRKAA